MYRKLALVTIGAVYFLILIGGIVRASGSGMGCPDWPKCFGTWIPPTNVDQLPVNYQEIFGAKLKGEVEFSAIKTWVEYVNRLVGVLIGFLIFISLVFSYREFWNTKKKVVAYSFLAFVLVGIEGLLGSKVVSSELNPVLITIHLILAILIVASLIYAVYSANISDEEQRISENDSLRFIVIILLVLSLGQLILGTQVREKIDELASNLVNRDEWLVQIKGGMFYFHIAFASVILIVHLVIYKTSNYLVKSKARYFFKALIAIVILEFISGSVLGLMDIPAVIQPLHLTLSTLIIGIQFTLFLFFSRPSEVKS